MRFTIGRREGLLRAETVADRLRQTQPKAKIVSLSLKDRGAIFGGGRSPDVSLWFDASVGRFVSSTAFTRGLPPWVRDTASPSVFKKHYAEPWGMLRPEWVAENAATADDQHGERNIDGYGTIFPHFISAASNPNLAFAASPWADAFLLQLGIAAVRAERSPESTFFLAISLSSNDYIGHTFGPDSWEAWDELARLDDLLAKFFRELDALVGEGGYAVVLSADHGTIGLPEAAQVPRSRAWCASGNADPWGRDCGKPGRLRLGKLDAELRQVARATLGDGEWIGATADPYVYLTRTARALPPGPRSNLIAALTKAIQAHPEIDRVVDVTTLPAECPPVSDESITALICRSYVPDTAGDLYLVAKPGNYLAESPIDEHGTSHGSPYLYDRSIPLLVKPFPTSSAVVGRTVEDPVVFSAFARTLSSLLGISPPRDALDGRDFAHLE